MRTTAIVPAFNCAAYVGAAIQSILEQTRHVDEIIVVDDGSTDDTSTVAQSFGERVTYVRTSNQGAAGARNAGLDRARGDFIAFLDADDAWYPEKIAHQLDALTRHPELQAVCCEFGMADESGRIVETRYIKRKYRVFADHRLDWPAMFPHSEPVPADSRSGTLYYGDAYRALFLGNFVNTSSIVLRRTAIEKAGRFTVGRRTQEDYEYWLRVAAAGALGYIDAPLLLFRRRPNQLTADDQKLRIARDTADVIRAESRRAESRLGRALVAQRLADRYRALALACLGAQSRREARQALAEAWRAGGHRPATLGLYLLSWVPDSLVSVLRAQRRRLTGGGTG
ncbi:MAG: glycosyltransferase family 2 protein [Vicinamibacterales bacterium]